MKKIIIMVFTAIVLSTGIASADTAVTGSLTLQSGVSYPQKELRDIIGDGKSYRANVFLGAKLNVPLINAAGIGADFTYSEYNLKDGYSGKFKRYTWDMIGIPLSFGPVSIEPGIAWNITDVQIKELGIDEVSIRPAGAVTATYYLGIIDYVALNASVRYENIMNDFEKAGIKDINISGEYLSGMAGVYLYF